MILKYVAKLTKNPSCMQYKYKLTSGLSAFYCIAIFGNGITITDYKAAFTHTTQQ